jgi:hypothetical protein
MDLILIGLFGLSLLLGAALRPGTSVFMVIPASLFCAAISAVYSLASKSDLATMTGATLGTAIACQAGYALSGALRRPRPAVRGRLQATSQADERETGCADTKALD